MYDAHLGRFHTVDRCSDSYYSLSHYGYCAGNPIKNIDVNGEFIGTIIGTVVGATTSAYDAYKNSGGNWNAVKAAAEGAVSGAIAGAAVDLAGAATVKTSNQAAAGIGMAAESAIKITEQIKKEEDHK